MLAQVVIFILLLGLKVLSDNLAAPTIHRKLHIVELCWPFPHFLYDFYKNTLLDDMGTTDHTIKY